MTILPFSKLNYLHAVHLDVPNIYPLFGGSTTTKFMLLYGFQENPILFSFVLIDMRGAIFEEVWYGYYNWRYLNP
jgi:hypothetical protein